MPPGVRILCWTITSLLLTYCSSDLPHDQTRSYLAIGDSYTIGEGVEPSEGFPAQLRVLLDARGEDVATPTIIARTGWTTSRISAAATDASSMAPFDLVTVLAGANDHYQGAKVESYRRDMRGLIEKAIELAGGSPARVVVISVPDWTVSPAGKSRRPSVSIDQFNDAARTLSNDLGTGYVDITAFSRRATDRTMFAPDGLHPSAMQYAEWARMILSEARRALAAGAV